ncbi:MAG: hypothetical protein WBE38_16190 [Terracidiphilus sp.]
MNDLLSLWYFAGSGDSSLAAKFISSVIGPFADIHVRFYGRIGDSCFHRSGDCAAQAGACAAYRRSGGAAQEKTGQAKEISGREGREAGKKEKKKT